MCAVINDSSSGAVIRRSAGETRPTDGNLHPDGRREIVDTSLTAVSLRSSTDQEDDGTQQGRGKFCCVIDLLMSDGVTSELV